MKGEGLCGGLVASLPVMTGGRRDFDHLHFRLCAYGCAFALSMRLCVCVFVGRAYYGAFWGSLGWMG